MCHGMRSKQQLPWHIAFHTNCVSLANSSRKNDTKSTPARLFAARSLRINWIADYSFSATRLVKMTMTSLGRPVEMGLLQSLGSV